MAFINTSEAYAILNANDLPDKLENGIDTDTTKKRWGSNTAVYQGDPTPNISGNLLVLFVSSYGEWDNYVVQPWGHDGQEISTITYNGVNMTRVDRRFFSDHQNTQEIWVMWNPPAGQGEFFAQLTDIQHNKVIMNAMSFSEADDIIGPFWYESDLSNTQNYTTLQSSILFNAGMATYGTVSVTVDGLPQQVMIDASNDDIITSALTGNLDAGVHVATTHVANGVSTQAILEITGPGDPPQPVPTITTRNGGTIGNDVYSGGDDLNDNGATIIAKGVVYSTSNNPSIGNGIQVPASVGSPAADFTSIITDLDYDTTYYVIAYATNSAGVGYGSVESFLTEAAPATNPVVWTRVPYLSIPYLEVTTGGGLVDGNDGGAPIIEKGILWSSTDTTPDLDDNIVTDGTGGGNWLTQIDMPSHGTTYYYRAYAKNDQNLYGFGAVEQFTIVPEIFVPNVYTEEVPSTRATSSTTGISGGTITNLSEAGTISARGVIYSTDPWPTYPAINTVNATENIWWESILEGLSPNTTYYVRAFAVNEKGVGLGIQEVFTTPAILRQRLTLIT